MRNMNIAKATKNQQKSTFPKSILYNYKVVFKSYLVFTVSRVKMHTYRDMNLCPYRAALETNKRVGDVKRSYVPAVFILRLFSPRLSVSEGRIKTQTT